MNTLSKIRPKVKQVIDIPVQIIENQKFIAERKHLRNQRKIIYALTPPSRLSNVGDHAQVVAIRIWLQKHFPNLPVIEVDKDESKRFLPALKKLTQPDDLIFLHSGGNLGDRGIWSESIRRLLITNFPQNQIISLPQTIYFSDTPKGRSEQEKTRQIYANHPNLTVIGRDPCSGELAKNLFVNARTFCMPDFVLSLPVRQIKQKNDPPKVLLCLRLDDESALTSQQRQAIAESLPYESSYFDTTLDTSIAVNQRKDILENTLDLFSAVDIVVTDRYHGLIFSVLCQKPCVVLPTVDHKLTSAMHWFKDVSFIQFANNLDDVPSLVESGLKINSRTTPNWNAKYFDNIPEMIGLQTITNVH
ncbi:MULTISPECIES: polysaccharide pyruvyl transferase family protein [Calothrix]|uniref:Polysaccharide pyruvyl transferase family protein n=2 Tax=Calothrix TaxID=1186 RepID=A0ABR8AND3_9CYAN|nr:MULTISPECIES: polysaccharide pyruvyl transferase family protein [Calothrix]MBD2200201.1 polysaccharide pyruvyl transferase family protein [Calothrix parietina FACHB-288]MBD2229174.1 polysaccharide pyruvyl transferase family protein [Calothrix anomala FACHB-343]